jgi:threonine aldolase
MEQKSPVEQPLIDLRSDTVTHPTPAMRAAMADALVGDDILRDDPTVLELEALSAELLGKEAAMFTISGTMSNAVAVMGFCSPGEEAILHSGSHMYNLEYGSMSALSGVQVRALDAPEGIFNLDELEAAIQAGDVQRPPTALICLENTFHLNRGLALHAKSYELITQLARAKGLKVYMDGARIFNAAIALGVPASQLTTSVDAVAVCLCKGLAAPLGSILAGSKEFIEKARPLKQRLGGGMRQAGVIAAPAIVALNDMTDRLADDHENATVLRQGLIELGLNVDQEGLQTNIVHLTLDPDQGTAAQLVKTMELKNILIKPIGKNACRMVTHYHITRDHIAYTIEAFKEVFN